MATEAELTKAVRESALRLTGAGRDYNALMDLIGDARFVLLGDASHGTHEFYEQRARITERLIREKGFTAVAVEADWPDAWRVNRYVRWESRDAFAVEALSDFKRFPAWMWRNIDVAAFVDWLRRHNDGLPEAEPKAGFYGLDLYGLRTAMEAVLQFLDQADPEAAKEARKHYACFDQFDEDTKVYGFLIGTGVMKSCADEAVSQLVGLQRRALEYAQKDARVSSDEVFNAEQNARLVKAAEEYYRSMFLRNVSTWNLRARHMDETLHALYEHLVRQDGRAKIAVWAHNSVVGDARAMEMSWRRGEVNLGQLTRQRYGNEPVRLVGFTTHHGSVTAASDWAEPPEQKPVPAALPESYEAIFHKADLGRMMLALRPGDLATKPLQESRIERAIGVVYHPETERVSHYFDTHLPEQFDALIHLDHTHAVEPLERNSEWERTEVPETYPFGV